MANPTQPSSFAPDVLEIKFEGPFSWPGEPDAASVFGAEAARDPGIYLWTIPHDEGYLVYYVGETGQSHKVRLLEHYREHASAMYHVYSPPEFARGRKVALWPGRYDKVRKSIAECVSAYPRLCNEIFELTQMYRFFLSPFHGEPRLRRRIEAGIAAALYSAPGLVGAFQDSGVRYDSRTVDETPIAFKVSCPAVLHGLSGLLEA